MRNRTLALAEQLSAVAVWVIGLSPAFFAVVVWSRGGTAAEMPSRAGAADDQSLQAAPTAWRLHAGELYAAAAIALLLAVIVLSYMASRHASRAGAAGPVRPGGGLVAAAVAMYCGPLLSAAFAGHGGVADWHLWLAPLAVIALYAAPPVPAEIWLRRLRRVLRVYSWGSLAALLIAPGWAVEQNKIVNFRLSFIGRLLGLTTFPILMGVLAAAILAFEVAPLYRSRFWLVHSCAAATVLLLAQSRTGWLAALAGIPLIYRRDVSRRVPPLFTRGWPIALVVCASPMIPALWNRIGYLSSSDEITTLHGRTEVWTMALNAFRSNILLGYGPTLFTDPASPVRGLYDHAHDQLLQSLSTAGLVGGAGLLLFAAALVIAGARTARKSAGLSVALIAIILVTCVTEAPLRGVGFDAYLLVVLATLGVCWTFAQACAEEAVDVGAAADPLPLVRDRRTSPPALGTATHRLSLDRASMVADEARS